MDEEKEPTPIQKVRDVFNRKEPRLYREINLALVDNIAISFSNSIGNTVAMLEVVHDRQTREYEFLFSADPDALPSIESDRLPMCVSFCAVPSGESATVTPITSVGAQEGKP